MSSRGRDWGQTCKLASDAQAATTQWPDPAMRPMADQAASDLRALHPEVEK